MCLPQSDGIIRSTARRNECKYRGQFLGGHNPTVLSLRRHPLMLRIGDDDRAIGELHLVARPVQHDIGGRDDPDWLAVGSDELVTNLNLPHRGPSGGSREWGVERQSL